MDGRMVAVTAESNGPDQVEQNREKKRTANRKNLFFVGNCFGSFGYHLLGT